MRASVSCRPRGDDHPYHADFHHPFSAFGGYLSPCDIETTDWDVPGSVPEKGRRSLETRHCFGFDDSAHDLFQRVVQGSRISLAVGFIGSGKSPMVFAMTGLLARNGTATGPIRLAGEEILNLPERRLNQIRANRIPMIFQDQLASLDPCMTIGQFVACHLR